MLCVCKMEEESVYLLLNSFKNYIFIHQTSLLCCNLYTLDQFSTEMEWFWHFHKAAQVLSHFWKTQNSKPVSKDKDIFCISGH